jgi:hypothetical protein
MKHLISLRFNSPSRTHGEQPVGASPLQIQPQITKRAGRPEVLLFRSARDGDGDVGTLSIREQ